MPRSLILSSVLVPTAVFLLACGASREPAAPTSTAAIATWEAGELTLSEVESAFAEARTPACQRARRGGVDDLLPCYRELAEGLVLERLIMAGIEDVDEAIKDLGDYEQLRQHAYVETYRRRLSDGIEITEAEIEDRYASDRDRYRRAGLLTLYNIFRRHQDPARPAATLAYLEDLKARFLAGETWDELARQHSQSETRLRGGLVGDVSEGRLPESLERIAFSLAAGGVSDPIAVRGGAVLLHVARKAQSIDFSLDEVRQRIERELRNEKMQAARDALIGDREPPAGSLVLAPSELVAALDSGEPQRLVLAVAGHRRTVEEIRQLAGLGPGELAATLDETAQQGLERIYRRQQDEPLLYLRLQQMDDEDLHLAAEEHLRAEATAVLADERLLADMQLSLADDPEALRGYFADNRHHYQSPLRFKLRIWSLPFGDDPPGQLRRMEALREQLAGGEIELAAAVSELGGTVETLGWRSFDELPSRLPPKARDHFIHLVEGGYSIAYQQYRALHVIHVEERQEPRPMTYAEAAEQVRADYLQRFRQELYRSLAAQRLEAAGFAYDEAAVRRLLAPVEVASPIAES